MEPQTLHILFVDDDPADTYLVDVALRKAREPDFKLRAVQTLRESYKALESQHFDAVLLDLGLPGTTGLETLDEFRRFSGTIPVVVLSGLDIESVAIESLDHGAQDYLIKNEVTEASLTRAIRHAIQRQSSLLEIQRLLDVVRANEALLQRKNERLRQLYDTAHNFVDNVSHEFRTPLTVVKEYVSLVREGALGEINDEQSRFLRIAEDRADDLNTMVDDMLDVSKLEAGLLAVHRTDSAMLDIAERIYPPLKRKAEIKNLNLSLDIDADLPTVYCDGEKVQRVIINLAVNAMKFTPPGGDVRIWAQSQGEEMLIGVSDNGPGIAPESLESIFERFEQVDIDVRSSTKGFGLGLNIANELVELNLGQMGVESEVGKGTTFTFTIPQADPIQVMRRFLARLDRGSIGFLSILTCQLARDASESTANDIDVFLSHLVRGNYLSFRTDPHHWLMLIPEPTSETQLFIDRAHREWEKVNRNRPKGPLPPLHYSIEHSWVQHQPHQAEILEHLRRHFPGSPCPTALVGQSATN